jgi:hypothetical protein
VRDHRFVGRNKAASCRYRLACQGERRAIRSANQFHHHVNAVSRGERAGIIHPLKSSQIDPAIPTAIPRRYRDDFDFPPRPAGDEIMIGGEQFDYPSTHGAKASKGDTKWFCHAAALRQDG